jgi:hypothetical protein
VCDGDLLAEGRFPPSPEVSLSYFLWPVPARGFGEERRGTVAAHSAESSQAAAVFREEAAAAPQLLTPIRSPPHPDQPLICSPPTYMSCSFHNSHTVHVKQTAYMDDSNGYLGTSSGLCAIYVGIVEWFEHLLWAMRLM